MKYNELVEKQFIKSISDKIKPKKKHLSMDYVKEHNLNINKIFSYIENGFDIDDEIKSYIMKNPKAAVWYSDMIIEDRWPEAEPYLMKYPEYAYQYLEDMISREYDGNALDKLSNYLSAYSYLRDLFSKKNGPMRIWISYLY